MSADEYDDCIKKSFPDLAYQKMRVLMGKRCNAPSLTPIKMAALIDVILDIASEDCDIVLSNRHVLYLMQLTRDSLFVEAMEKLLECYDDNPPNTKWLESFPDRKKGSVEIMEESARVIIQTAEHEKQEQCVQGEMGLRGIDKGK
jgi:hypothetical protein